MFFKKYTNILLQSEAYRFEIEYIYIEELK